MFFRPFYSSFVLLDFHVSVFVFLCVCVFSAFMFFTIAAAWRNKVYILLFTRTWNRIEFQFAELEMWNSLICMRNFHNQIQIWFYLISLLQISFNNNNILLSAWSGGEMVKVT